MAMNKYYRILDKILATGKTQTNNCLLYTSDAADE